MASRPLWGMLGTLGDVGMGETSRETWAVVSGDKRCLFEGDVCTHASRMVTFPISLVFW